jgi:hypothetical protein
VTGFDDALASDAVKKPPTPPITASVSNPALSFFMDSFMTLSFCKAGLRPV